MIATTYCAPLPSHADVTFEKSALGPKINIFGTITKADANALPVFKGAAKPPAPCQGIPYKVVDRFCATVDLVVLPFEFQSRRTRGIRFLTICLRLLVSS